MWRGGKTIGMKTRDEYELRTKNLKGETGIDER